MTEPPESLKLWDLQNLDLQIQRLEDAVNQSPERTRFERLRLETERSRQKITTKRDTLQTLQQAMDKHEREINDIQTEIETLEDKLYSGVTTHAKEFLGMENQLETHRKNKARLEDATLAMMQEADDISARLSGLQNEARTVTQHARVLKDELEQKIEQARIKRRALRTKRDSLANTVAPAWLRHYEQVRKRVNEPVALVAAGHCGGCRVLLSRTVITQALSNQPGPTYCDHCGRILYAEGRAAFAPV